MKRSIARMTVAAFAVMAIAASGATNAHAQDVTDGTSLPDGIAQEGCDEPTACDDGNACTVDICVEHEDDCGDATADGRITAVDALHILRAATELESGCTISLCDVDMDGAITSTDSLRALAQAIGLGGFQGCFDGCSYEFAVCEDGDACTVDACDPETGCNFDGETCDDGDACTIDMCGEGGECMNEPVVCDDNDPCTADSCGEDGECIYEPHSCDDGDPCTVDSCGTEGACVNEPVSCDDGDPCTVDSCGADGACLNEPVVCDDGNACTVDSCGGTEGGCIFEPLVCDDGDVCNGQETCDEATGCVVGEALMCDDGNICTDDVCDAVEGCIYDNVTCDDGDACTDDLCSEAEGCVHAPVVCDDGDVCNGVETCDAASGCVDGEALVCDDGAFCNGVETCDSASGCVDGEAPNCDDGDSCNVDSCDEDADACVNEGPKELGSDTISFNGLARGTIVDVAYGDDGLGPVYVAGANKRLPGLNAAVVYDSSCEGGCTGKGNDLGTPNESFGGPGTGADGREGAIYENAVAQAGVLIVARDLDDVDPEDGLVDVPVDQGNRREVSTSFDFVDLAPVIVEGVTVIDSDFAEAVPMVELYDAAGTLLATQALPVTGDNGVARVDLDEVDGATKMVVTLFGSGAIDDIRFRSLMCIEQETQALRIQ